MIFGFYHKVLLKTKLEWYVFCRLLEIILVVALPNNNSLKYSSSNYFTYFSFLLFVCLVSPGLSWGYKQHGPLCWSSGPGARGGFSPTKISFSSPVLIQTFCGPVWRPGPREFTPVTPFSMVLGFTIMILDFHNTLYWLNIMTVCYFCHWIHPEFIH